jgi:hypothetical protein
MDNIDRLQLEKMIKANNVEDVTEEIRTKKHSDLIRRDVIKLLEIKKKYPRLDKTQQMDTMLTKNCSFLFMNYTDIFNKVRKNEIDLNILGKFLDILKKIEDGDLNQHEGAFEVGKLLKAMYIDSALKKSDKIDKKNKKRGGKQETTSLNSPKNISWKQYKELNN